MLNKFYRKLIEQENISHKQALAIYEAMHAGAVSLGIISSQSKFFVHARIFKGLMAIFFHG
ncbi:MAG: hypothetical protein DRP65_07565 [Planctomycetota bacterium]|nr:MAG: hypothetical protein DRP65_07565 [Planctomycetota bacterium]